MAVAFHEPVVGGAEVAVLRVLPHLEARGWRFVFWTPGPGPLRDELLEARLRGGRASPACCATAPPRCACPRDPWPGSAACRAISGASAAGSTPYRRRLPGQHLHHDPRGHRGPPRRRSGAHVHPRDPAARRPAAPWRRRLIRASVDTGDDQHPGVRGRPFASGTCPRTTMPTTGWSCPPTVPGAPAQRPAAGGGHARAWCRAGRAATSSSPPPSRCSAAPGRGVPDDRPEPGGLRAALGGGDDASRDGRRDQVRQGPGPVRGARGVGPVRAAHPARGVRARDHRGHGHRAPGGEHPHRRPVEIVTPETGLLVPPEDPDSLAAAIVELAWFSRVSDFRYRIASAVSCSGMLRPSTVTRKLPHAACTGARAAVRSRGGRPPGSRRCPLLAPAAAAPGRAVGWRPGPRGGRPSSAPGGAAARSRPGRP